MQTSGLLTASNVSLRFEERIDVDALNALCKHDDVDTANKKLLGKIRKAIVRGNVVPTEYIPSARVVDADGFMPIGRFYVKGGVGLQGLTKDYRSALAAKHYTDLDIVNCHPSLLLDIARAEFPEDATFPAIANYVENRNALFTSITDTNTGMTRGDAKVQFLKLLFNHYPNSSAMATSLSASSRAFHDEVARIADHLISPASSYSARIAAAFAVATGASAKPVDRKKALANPRGLALSVVLCEMEATILDQIVKSMAVHGGGRRVDVPIHDGCCVSKLTPDEERLPDEVLNAVCADVSALFDGRIHIRLESKPFTTTLTPLIQSVKTDVDKRLEVVRKQVHHYSSYEVAKVMFEKEFSWIRDLSKFAWCDSDRAGKIVYKTKADLITDCVSWTYEKKNEKTGDVTVVPFAQDWVRDPDRKSYKSVQMRPKCESDPMCLNAFPESGFLHDEEALALKEPVVSIDDPRIAPLKKLLDMVSNHDAAVRTYLIYAIAWMMQRPSEILRVCIVLIGKAGTGKDFLWKFVGRELLGRSFYVNIGADCKRLLFGDFSKHALNAILFHSEEVKLAVNKEFRDKLFSMITADETMSEGKGIDADQFFRYTNYVMTSNSDTPLAIEEDDRRFVIIRTSSERQTSIDGNASWWKEFYDITHKLDHIIACASFFLGIDLSKFAKLPCEPMHPFNPIGDRPNTDAYKAVKTATRPLFASAMQRFVEFIAQSIQTELGDDEALITEKRKEVVVKKYSEYRARDLQAKLADYMREMLSHAEGRGAMSILNDTAFGREMHSFLEAGCVVKRKSMGCMTYVFDYVACETHMRVLHLWVEM